MKQTYLTKTSIILMAFMLSASPAVVKTSAAATTPEDSAPVTTSETGASLKLSKKTYEKKFQTKKGLVYKTISYEYPLAEGDSDAADAFNQFYDTLRTSWIKSARKNLEEAKKAVKDLEGSGDDRYYADKVTCKITRNDKNYISILQSGYDFSLGAHGMPYRISHTFDAATGTELTAADLLDMNKKELNKTIRKKYLKKFDQTKGTDKFLFYENRKEVKKELEKIEFNQSFYLKKNKLHFYTEPYSAGPYAAGYIEITVTLP